MIQRETKRQRTSLKRLGGEDDTDLVRRRERSDSKGGRKEGGIIVVGREPKRRSRFLAAL